jgi:hypothetical protein
MPTGKGGAKLPARQARIRDGNEHLVARLFCEAPYPALPLGAPTVFHRKKVT